MAWRRVQNQKPRESNFKLVTENSVELCLQTNEENKIDNEKKN